jgi:hypothetical protein
MPGDDVLVIYVGGPWDGHDYIESKANIEPLLGQTVSCPCIVDEHGVKTESAEGTKAMAVYRFDDSFVEDGTGVYLRFDKTFLKPGAAVRAAPH